MLLTVQLKDLSLNIKALYRQSLNCLYVATAVAAFPSLNGTGTETQQPLLRQLQLPPITLQLSQPVLCRGSVQWRSQKDDLDQPGCSSAAAYVKALLQRTHMFLRKALGEHES